MKRAYAVVVGQNLKEGRWLSVQLEPGSLAAAGFQPGDQVEIRPRFRDGNGHVCEYNPLDELPTNCGCASSEKPVADLDDSAARRRIRALAPPSAPPASPSAPNGTCANLWHPGHGRSVHPRREAVGDLAAVHVDHVNDSGCLNWKPASAPPSPVSDDRLLLLKALFEGRAEIRDEHGEQALVVWIPTRIGRCGSEFQIPSLEKPFTDSLRAALTEATHG